MAQRVVTQLLDDIDQSPADETVTFGLDSGSYEIDLSSGHAAELREALAPYVEAGRRTGAKTATSRRSARSKPSATAPDPKDVREWAVQQGKTVSARGRVPAALVVEFQEAHGG